MFTLKIYFTNHRSTEPKGPLELLDENTLFVGADQVHVFSLLSGETWEEKMSAWEIDSYTNKLCIVNYDHGETGEIVYSAGRLIQVEKNGEQSWFLASKAWLLGPNGDTIERLI